MESNHRAPIPHARDDPAGNGAVRESPSIPKRLTDVNLLKRHILKRYIYGVDINPMAVELAKVSLWLDCFTLGAPLSFLDHHLRCGNSLIGVTVEEVDKIRAATEQLTLSASSDWQGLLQAIQGMIEVGGLPDVTSAQVARSRTAYRSALSNLRKFQKDSRHSYCSLVCFAPD